ncbi:hypothetical protein Q5H93_13555 [Hymenobacter sp. ASUV-10]|uniref:Tissue inhibitor of metalloproteinase n=1 Tax=Hymenobacter aranciens TaxID=3063996 RepID=A0ABT9BBX0_9BACT|nr:hypothetical protein [Hymenobacter sp. ASUV-10]MDO7875764.1 hypothetical protein [Hymenobacter sp. ASUV-10]
MNKIILLLALLLAGAPAWACSCITEDIPEAHKITKSFQRATLVFVGRVLKAENVAAAPQDAAAMPVAKVRYTFAITRLYKGEKVDSTIVLETPAQSATCGVSFIVGSEHLLYANTTSPATGAVGKSQPHYAISLCDRHQALRDVKSSELRQLKQMAYKASGEHRFTWFELGD